MSRVVFLGSKPLGLSCLKRIYEESPDSVVGIVTFDDSADSRTALEGFHSFASSTGLPLAVARNRADSERLVRGFRPDICLVVGWYWLISPETLRSVPRGFLGIHNSLLPRYRGAAPLVWAMINGEREVGFSLFSFTEGMDDGPVWGRRAIPVEEADYISDVLEKLGREAVSLLDSLWIPILEGRATPDLQDESDVTYCAARQPGDGRIDWTRPARKIYDFVRAQSEPYPGAFAQISGGPKLTVWRARSIDVRYYGTPGQVAQIRPDGVYVICGDDRPLLIQEVGLEDRSKVAASDVLKSLKIRLG